VAIESFWIRLLSAVEHVREGEWRLLSSHGWPGNESARALLAWRWAHHLVVVNYGPDHAEGNVEIDVPATRLRDLLDGASYDYGGGELFVALPPFGAHLFELS
jgi:hypothetical protein